ncbi:MAG: hypothetical protein ACX930_11510 [Erythrobacter sp.]
MFEAIGSRTDYLLAHVTLAQDKIVSEGTIYPSAGCLVGSLYCVPIEQEGDRLRLHNLGAYYYLREARDLAPDADTEPSILVAKVRRKKPEQSGIEGVNYLRMGEVHYNCIERHEDLDFDLSGVKPKVLDGLTNAEDFLVRTVAEINEPPNSTAQDIEYLDQASDVINRGNMPFFGYALFEALSVCLMLYQTDDESVRSRERGEFNNWNYKDLSYEILDVSSDSFRLSNFHPDWNEIFQRIERTHWMELGVDRFACLVAARARRYIAHNSLVDYFSFDGLKRRVGTKLTWEDAEKVARPLLGHTAHRLIRNVEPDKYADMFRWFEEDKAKMVWGYWNTKKVTLPFNGVIPKGEMGINPVSPELTIEFYSTSVTTEGRDVFVELDEKLDLKMARNLGSLRHTFMRDQTGAI